METNSQMLIIGISGGSGSGKTSIVKALKDQFDENELCLLSLDDYYIPREQQLTDENGIQNFDLPSSIDSEALVDDILKLQAGKVVTRTEYVFNNENSIPQQLIFKPAPILIVEGIFIYAYSKVRAMLDVKVFVEVDHAIKLQRRIKRDHEERNYPESDVLYRFEHHVTPSFDKYVEPYKSVCDIVVNNNVDYTIGLEMLSAFIQSKLDTPKV